MPIYIYRMYLLLFQNRIIVNKRYKSFKILLYVDKEQYFVFFVSSKVRN